MNDNTASTPTTPTTLPTDDGLAQTVIAQLPPCPSWCRNHPYADDAMQVHEAVVSEGNWFENELPESGNLARGGVRLRQSESFNFEARTVERDATVTVELFTLAPEGSQYKIAAYLNILSPRAVAAALLAASDALDDCDTAASTS